MRVDKTRFHLALATACKCARDLRPEVSASTVTRIKQGRELGTKTVGKIARALGIPVEELIEKGE